MTLTDQDRRDRIDAAAATLDDIGMPTLANRLRETADELLPTDTAAARTPGQIAYEAFTGVYPTGVSWADNRRQAAWEYAARAVIDHHEQQTENERCESKRDSLRCDRERGHAGPHWRHRDSDYAEWPDSTLEPEPDPAWVPRVGAWAEHRGYGRALVLLQRSPGGNREWLVGIPGLGEMWVRPADLSAPQPRVWESAEDVPAHVVVTDASGIAWAGIELCTDAYAPFTELLPVGGVW